MVDDDPVADRQLPAGGADGDDLPARFVAGDDPLIRLGSAAEVLAVDRTDVAAADGGRPHAEQDLPGPRFGHLDGHLLDGAVAGKHDAGHGCHELSSTADLP